MKTNTKHLLKREEGFTLVEVIAVLIILGILAAVAVPKYINLEEDAKKRAIDAAISELNGRESMTWAQVKISPPVDSTGNLLITDDDSMDLEVWKKIKTVSSPPVATDGPSYFLNTTGVVNYVWDSGGDPSTSRVTTTKLKFQNSNFYPVERIAATLQTPAIWKRTAS